MIAHTYMRPQRETPSLLRSYRDSALRLSGTIVSPVPAKKRRMSGAVAVAPCLALYHFASEDNWRRVMFFDLRA